MIYPLRAFLGDDPDHVTWAGIVMPVLSPHKGCKKDDRICAFWEQLPTHRTCLVVEIDRVDHIVTIGGKNTDFPMNVNPIGKIRHGLPPPMKHIVQQNHQHNEHNDYATK